MALYHRATLTPSKAEMVTQWLPTQPWCPQGEPIGVIGAYRFDDPEGQVGIETHVVAIGDSFAQVPMTYRPAPVESQAHALIGTMEHSALGTRWVYDGLSDPRYLVMLAAVAMTGQGEALGMVVYDGAWFIAPTNVRITGGGWTGERVSVDGFSASNTNTASVLFQNDQFDMTVHRQLSRGVQPDIGLTAAIAGNDAPLVLTSITER